MPTFEVYELFDDVYSDEPTENYIGTIEAEDGDDAMEQAHDRFGAPIRVKKADED